MSLTRKLLKGMSLTDEQIETIIENHTETVDGLKASIDELKESNETLTKDNKKLQKIQTEYEELKKSVEENGENPFETKYNELKDEYSKYRSDVEAEKAQAKKETAYRKALKDAGVSEKRIDSVLKLAKVDGKLDDIAFDEKDNLVDGDKIVNAIKTDYAEYIQTLGTAGAHVSNPPSNVGGGKMSKDEIMQIKDTSARQQAMLANKELFIN